MHGIMSKFDLIVRCPWIVSDWSVRCKSTRKKLILEELLNSSETEDMRKIP